MRVSESDIARIVTAIAGAKKRPTPKRGDMEGDYEAWFDGGAIRYVTGSTQYFFRDGSMASVALNPESVSITIRMADGRVVNITQQ
jgi:hypothetical protein